MDEKTLAELSSTHCRLQAKCQPEQTSYIKRINLFLFAIIHNKHFITEPSLVGPVWENLDLGLYSQPRPRLSPPTRLIRAKEKNKDGSGWRRFARNTHKLEKVRLTFSRCTNRT